jgi:hypothetical protein
VAKRTEKEGGKESSSEGRKKEAVREKRPKSKEKADRGKKKTCVQFCTSFLTT